MISLCHVVGNQDGGIDMLHTGSYPVAEDDTLIMEYNPQTQTYHVQYDWSTSLSTTIILAIGQITSEDQEQIGPLNESIEPDALNDLFKPTPTGHRRPEGQLSFTVDGWKVTVESTGEITICAT